MKTCFCDQFWYDESVPRSRAFELLPDVHRDGRGFFVELARHESGPTGAFEWYRDLSWIRQVNRSSSSPGVARGMHAQSGASCQGKLVQAAYGRVLDVVTDARPDSETFGVSDVFELDSEKQNMLWVPRGFLHGFAVPRGQSGPAVFEYFCDNVYDKAAEVSIAPDGFMQKILRLKSEMDPSFVFEGGLTLSEKDAKGAGYEDWMYGQRAEYRRSGGLWYKSP